MRSGSVWAGRRWLIVSCAEAYSAGARQRLLSDRDEETVMDGIIASAIAIKVVHCDSVRT